MNEEQISRIAADMVAHAEKVWRPFVGKRIAFYRTGSPPYYRIANEPDIPEGELLEIRGAMLRFRLGDGCVVWRRADDTSIVGIVDDAEARA